MILFNGNQVDMAAYEQGRIAYIVFEQTKFPSPETANPYPEKSDEWTAGIRGGMKWMPKTCQWM